MLPLFVFATWAQILQDPAMLPLSGARAWILFRAPAMLLSLHLSAHGTKWLF